jgi:dipeptide/tripeptide permease
VLVVARGSVKMSINSGETTSLNSTHVLIPRNNMMGIVQKIKQNKKASMSAFLTMFLIASGAGFIAMHHSSQNVFSVDPALSGDENGSGMDSIN